MEARNPTKKEIAICYPHIGLQGFYYKTMGKAHCKSSKKLRPKRLTLFLYQLHSIIK
jgi:hypothetical protein